MLLFPQNYKVFRFPQNLKRISNIQKATCSSLGNLSVNTSFFISHVPPDMICFTSARQSVPAELTPRCFVRPSYRLPRPRFRENLYPAGTSHFPRPWAGHVRRNRPPALLTLSHLLDDSMKQSFGNFCSSFRSTPFHTSLYIQYHPRESLPAYFLTLTKRSRSSRRRYIPAAVPPYVHISALKN